MGSGKGNKKRVKISTTNSIINHKSCQELIRENNEALFLTIDEKNLKNFLESFQGISILGYYLGENNDNYNINNEELSYIFQELLNDIMHLVNLKKINDGDIIKSNIKAEELGIKLKVIDIKNKRYESRVAVDVRILKDMSGNALTNDKHPLVQYDKEVLSNYLKELSTDEKNKEIKNNFLVAIINHLLTSVNRELNSLST